MKKLLLILMLFFTACNEKLEEIGTDYIEGVISDTESCVIGSRDGNIFRYYLYVSDGKHIERVQLPYDIYKKYQKSDSCLLLIKKYKVNDGK